MGILLPSEITVKDIKLNDVKTLDNGSKFVGILYKGKKLMLQTPYMKMPYDFTSTFKGKDGKELGNGIKNDIVLSFGDYENEDNLKQFYDKMNEINDYIVEQAISNKAKWFDGKKSDALIREINTSMVKPYIDPSTKEISDKYPPTIKFKIPIDANGAYTLEHCVHMETKENMDFNDIKGKLKGGYAKFSVHLTGVWISSGMFGIQGKIRRARFSFKDDDEDDDFRDDDEDMIKVVKDKMKKEADEELLADSMASMAVGNKKPTKSKSPVDSEDDDVVKVSDDNKTTTTKNNKKNDEEVEETDDDDEEETDETEEEEEEEEDEPEPEPEPEPVKKSSSKKSSSSSKKK